MEHSEARISGAYMRLFYLYFLANHSLSHMYVRARCPEYCELAPNVLKSHLSASLMEAPSTRRTIQWTTLPVVSGIFRLSLCHSREDRRGAVGIRVPCGSCFQGRPKPPSAQPWDLSTETPEAAFTDKLEFVA
jgi:hypothetical protein